MRLLCLWLMLYTSYTCAQVNPGARFTALGRSGAALEDLYSLGSNQAGIARTKYIMLGMVYVEPYLGTGIRSQSGFFAVPTTLGVWGIYVGSFGLADSYNELKAGATYAKAFGPRLAMALTLNYHQLSIPNYGSNTTFSIDYGVHYRFNDQISSAFHIANPGRFAYTEDLYATIPTLLTLGTAFSVSEEVRFCADLVYEWLVSVDGRFGLEYSVIKWLDVRGGISLNDFQQYIGFGLRHRDFRLDAATSVHPRLGLSPQIALCYEF